MSIKALQEYTRFSKYAKYLPEKQRRETWPEQVKRVFDMHEQKFSYCLDELTPYLEIAEKALHKKEILGSQRALQFGGKPILDKNCRIYNCAATYIDRPRFFQELMFILMCGCGAGFSVQTHHVAKLPNVYPVDKKSIKTFIIPDSIEGWSNAIGILLSSYFTTEQPFPEYAQYNIDFDYSLIRPEGAPISHGGKAPGPEGLKLSIEEIRKILDKATYDGDRQLKPIECYDICMHISDSVLSGGIRRSATLCLFSIDDIEMREAKTGSWFHDNPQRARSNNSVMLVRGETTHEQFSELMESVKQFGEPGFIWSEDKEIIFNPCVEISLYGYDKDGNSGWEMCNLCEINMKKAETEELFYSQCRAAAILGTLQAAYTKFNYLGSVTENIVNREALLGVSMTGMMDNPEIAFNEKIQRHGAKLILKMNEEIANIIGINPCARATCIKPAGNSSCVLGTASGIHPHHANRYFRHVQANKTEPALHHFKKFNPLACEESVWSQSNTDVVIKFLCEVPTGAKTKNQIGALELLGFVKLTQQNWVESGTRKERCVLPTLRHNVSNTCNVKPEEWHEVEKYIYANRRYFAGISLLPMSGDKDYAQAPFTAIFTPHEVIKEYGDGAMFASGLIVDALRVFDDNLWTACDTILNVGKIPLDIYEYTWEDYTVIGDQCDLFRYTTITDEHIQMPGYVFQSRKDWLRRAKQFADRYFDKDVRKMTYCLKDVRNWKIWCDLRREYKDVKWDEFTEENDNTKMAEVVACAGGSCDII